MSGADNSDAPPTLAAKLQALFDKIPNPATGKRFSDEAARAEIARRAARRLARREAGEPGRDWLRRAARIAAVHSQDPEEFFRRLDDFGIAVKPRESPPGQLVGYALAADGDQDPDGAPAWHSGPALARDLSLPQLQERWRTSPAPAHRREIRSHTYIWQLRTGRRDNPTIGVLESLADLFGVPVTYFTEAGPAAAALREELEVIAAMRDAGVMQVMNRVRGMSPSDRRVLLSFIEHAKLTGPADPTANGTASE